MEQFYRDYCRTITALDEQIGRILAELDKLGIADQTLIIYAGDNGIFWGEKQFIDKRWPYEEATRIPFIVKYPGGLKNPGRTSAELVLNVDLAPTLLDMAGLPVLPSMQGKSFRSILENQNTPLRQSFHMEYFKDFPYRVPEYDAVRTERFLYGEYRGRKKPELFDIQRDPRTLVNLIDFPRGKEVLPELKGLLQSYLRGKTGGWRYLQPGNEISGPEGPWARRGCPGDLVRAGFYHRSPRLVGQRPNLSGGRLWVLLRVGYDHSLQPPRGVSGPVFSGGFSGGENRRLLCGLIRLGLEGRFLASEIFTAGESLYYALSPMPLGLIVFQVGYMSLGEMLCRWRVKKRGGQDIRIFTAGPVIGIAVLGIMSYVMIFWGVPAESPGTKWFYIYQEGYKALFG
jgi:hypothetical protein